MNKSLLLIPMLFSMAFGDDFQFLPPKPAEPQAPIDNQSLDLIILGLSDHSNKGCHYNQTNPGEALVYGYKFHPERDNTEIIVSTGTYKDSMDNRASFGVVGMRILLLGSPHSFNSTFSFSVGPWHGSGSASWGVIPVLTVGYDKFSIGCTGSYAKNRTAYNDDGTVDKTNSSTSVIAVFADIKILTW